MADLKFAYLNIDYPHLVYKLLKWMYVEHNCSEIETLKLEDNDEEVEEEFILSCMNRISGMYLGDIDWKYLQRYLSSFDDRQITTADTLEDGAYLRRTRMKNIKPREYEPIKDKLFSSHSHEYNVSKVDYYAIDMFGEYYKILLEKLMKRVQEESYYFFDKTDLLGYYSKMWNNFVNGWTSIDNDYMSFCHDLGYMDYEANPKKHHKQEYDSITGIALQMWYDAFFSKTWHSIVFIPLIIRELMQGYFDGEGECELERDMVERNRIAVEFVQNVLLKDANNIETEENDLLKEENRQKRKANEASRRYRKRRKIQHELKLQERKKLEKKNQELNEEVHRLINMMNEIKHIK